ncbi:MAG: hypothetical protein ABSG22_11765 [Sedimentisphaerales bacterium]
MKIKSLLVLILMPVLSLTIAANAAEPNNVGNILKGNGFDWLFGKWETISDSNQKFEAEFELEADGYAISIEAKAGKNEHTGIVYYSPVQKAILYTGIDSSGRIYTGTWEIRGDKLILNIELTVPDGATSHFVRYLSKVDTDTIKSVTYNVVDGKRSEEPIGTLVFKRDK